MGMMALLGFEGRDLARDQIIATLNTPTYNTDVPGDSESSRSLLGQLFTQSEIRYPWKSGDGSTFNTPSGTVYWFGWRWKRTFNNTNNDVVRVGTEYNGTEGISVSLEDNTLKLTIRANGSVVATASIAALTLSAWARLSVKVDHQVGGLVSVYFAGDHDTPVVEYTLTAPDVPASKPNGFQVRMDSDYIDDMWAMDPADGTGTVNPALLLQASIKGQVFTGDGNYTAWTGTYADIDELPASDADDIDVAAIDQRSSFTHPVIAVTTVLAVKVNARVTRTGTDAGAQIEVFAREGGADLDLGIQAAPGDGDITALMQTDRAGATWSATKYDATEFGVVSRT